MKNETADYISQELDFTKIDKTQYRINTPDDTDITGTLDCRYWINKVNFPLMGLLITTSTGEKIRFSVFKNMTTKKYSPKAPGFKEFCCREDLALGNKIRIVSTKSSRSEKLYVREIYILK